MKFLKSFSLQRFNYSFAQLSKSFTHKHLPRVWPSGGEHNELKLEATGETKISRMVEDHQGFMMI